MAGLSRQITKTRVVPDFGSASESPVNPESDHFSEIRPSPAPDKFLAGFVDLADASAAAVRSVAIVDKTNAADLLRGVFVMLISVTQTKQNTKFTAVRQKLANSDVTKETPNCTASL